MADQQRRSSKRRRSSSIDSMPSLDDGDDCDSFRDINVSARQVSSCIEWGMPQVTCCTGCIKFADDVGLSIDFRDHDALMIQALPSRKKKGQRKQCLQLWTKPESALTNKEHKRMRNVQHGFITNRGYNPDCLQLFTGPNVTPATTAR